jgi:hypothetical protein
MGFIKCDTQHDRVIQLKGVTLEGVEHRIDGEIASRPLNVHTGNISWYYKHNTGTKLKLKDGTICICGEKPDEITKKIYNNHDVITDLENSFADARDKLARQWHLTEIMVLPKGKKKWKIVRRLYFFSEVHLEQCISSIEYMVGVKLERVKTPVGNDSIYEGVTGKARYRVISYKEPIDKDNGEDWEAYLKSLYSEDNGIRNYRLTSIGRELIFVEKEED